MNETAPALITAEWVDAVSAVAADLSAVGKDRKSGDGYGYRGIDDVINALHPLLCRHKVVIVPRLRAWSVDPWKGYRHDPDRNPWTRTSVMVDYQVIGPDGCAVEMTAVGEGIDNSDKGVGKAMSYAYKSFVSQLFSIPTDDPSMDTEHAASPVVELIDDKARKKLMAETRNQRDRLGPESQEWTTIKDGLIAAGIIDSDTGRPRTDIAADVEATWVELISAAKEPF